MNNIETFTNTLQAHLNTLEVVNTTAEAYVSELEKFCIDELNEANVSDVLECAWKTALMLKRIENK